MNWLLVLSFKISYSICASQIYNTHYITILYALYNILVYNILYISIQYNADKNILQRYNKKYGIV